MSAIVIFSMLDVAPHPASSQLAARSSQLAGKAPRPLRGEVPKVEHDSRWYTLH